MGPTLVAMATKFGLDAEIQSPTGLSVNFLAVVRQKLHALLFTQPPCRPIGKCSVVKKTIAHMCTHVQMHAIM